MRNSNNTQEIADPNPIELAISRQTPQSYKDEVMEMVRNYFQNQSQDQEFETVEEFWDMDMDEDPDPIASAYEVEDMQEEFYEPPAHADSAAPDESGTEPQQLESPPQEGSSQTPDQEATPPPADGS